MLDRHEYATLLVRHIEASGLTLDALGERLGTSRQTLVRWKKGDGPNPMWQKKLGAYFADQALLERRSPNRKTIEISSEGLRNLAGLLRDAAEGIERQLSGGRPQARPSLDESRLEQ